MRLYCRTHGVYLEVRRGLRGMIRRGEMEFSPSRRQAVNTCALYWHPDPHAGELVVCKPSGAQLGPCEVEAVNA